MTWIDDAKVLVTENEGVRYQAYEDQLGVPTIGIGFNLRRADASDRMASVGTTLGQVLQGATLTAMQVESLFNQDTNQALQDLGQLFGAFDQLPDPVKVALVDMRYNLGPIRLRGFVKMVAAINACDWVTAAAQASDSTWSHQLPKRAAHDIGLILSAVQPTTP